MNVEWKIEWIKCIPQVGDIENYVAECGWRCNATEQEASASAYGSSSFAVSNAEDSFTAFIPFDQLTEALVLSWVWGSGIDKEAVEAALKQQIDSILKPAVVIAPLPWLNGE